MSARGSILANMDNAGEQKRAAEDERNMIGRTRRFTCDFSRVNISLLHECAIYIADSMRLIGEEYEGHSSVMDIVGVRSGVELV